MSDTDLDIYIYMHLYFQMTQMNHNEFKARVGRTTFEVVGCDHEFNTIISKVGYIRSFYVSVR